MKQLFETYIPKSLCYFVMVLNSTPLFKQYHYHQSSKYYHYVICFSRTNPLLCTISRHFMACMRMMDETKTMWMHMLFLPKYKPYSKEAAAIQAKNYCKHSCYFHKKTLILLLVTSINLTRIEIYADGKKGPD